MQIMHFINITEAAVDVYETDLIGPMDLRNPLC